MLQFDRNGYEFATLVRRAWLMYRFGEHEQANYIWEILYKAFYKTLSTWAKHGIIQLRAIQLQSRYNKGFTSHDWFIKSKKMRIKGDKFYKAVHGKLKIDPVAIWAAEGAIGTMMLDFKKFAKANKGCPIKSVSNKWATNYNVLLWFSTRAAIEYNDDIRRNYEKEKYNKKLVKRTKRKFIEASDSQAIASEIKMQYKAMVNEILQSCDEQQVSAWANRIANNKKGRPVAGTSKKEKWWVMAGLSKMTAMRRSDIVRNKLDAKFIDSNIDGTDDILSEVKVEFAKSLVK